MYVHPYVAVTSRVEHMFVLGLKPVVCFRVAGGVGSGGGEYVRVLMGALRSQGLECQEIAACRR